LLIKDGIIRDRSIYGVPVIIDLLPRRKNYSRWIKTELEYITNHNTDNWKKGADAKANVKYLKSVRLRSLSWHLTVDDHCIIQTMPLIYNGWHCTDGHDSDSGNITSIGIEGCLNKDGNWKTTRLNMIKLNVYLMNNLPNLKGDNWKKTIVGHYWWYKKNCPSQILKEKGGFTAFRNDCIQYNKDLIAKKDIFDYEDMLNELSDWGKLYISDVKKIVKENNHNWPGIIEKLYYHAGKRS